MTFEYGSVVAVPFPFTDRDTRIRRPAVIVSSARHFNTAAGHSVMAMITRSSPGKPPWPLDTPIDDLHAAGLPVPSLVRLKLFTLDHRLVIRTLGRLEGADRKQLGRHLAQLLQAD